MAARMINLAAAWVAPRRELDVFAHRLQADGRSWRHHALYSNGPGALSIEFGGWTIDVSWRTVRPLRGSGDRTQTG
jgi:hypothetical protein